MRIYNILIFIALTLALSRSATAQTTLRENRPAWLFETARELFLKERYSSAHALFTQYAVMAQNPQLEADARFYAAICLAELQNKRSPAFHQEYRDKHPESTRKPISYFSLGKYYFGQKAYDKALMELIEVNPYDLPLASLTEYYFMTGYAQFYRGNIHEAKPYFKEILEEKGQFYGLTNYFYGYITFGDEEYTEALEAFQRIEQEESFRDIMPVYITEVYSLMGNDDRVIDYGKKALNKPGIRKKEVIHLLIAQSLFRKGQIKEAKPHYEKYATSRIMTAEDSYQYGYACFITEDYQQALKLFETFVLDEDSLGQNVAYHLAGTHLALDNKLEARTAFSTAMQYDFDQRITEQAHFYFAQLSNELKFHKAAIQTYQDYINQYPNGANTDEVKEQLVRLLLASKNYAKAFEVVANLANPTPKIDQAYQRLAFNIGLEYYDVKNYPKAREYLQLSLSRPKHEGFAALAHFWIAESWVNNQQYSRGIDAYKQFLVNPKARDLPIYAITQYNLGFCFFKQQEYKQALFHFNEYEKANNTLYTKQFNSDVNARTADCYQKLKLYEKSLNYYDKVIELNYADMDYAYYQKGMIYGLIEQFDKKIQMMSLLTQKYNQSGYMDDAIYEMANTRFLVGNKAQALREFEYLNQDYPDNLYFKQAQIKIGIIYNQLGQEQKAIDIFKSIVAQFPSSPESKDALRVMKSIYVENNRVEEFYSTIDQVAGIAWRQTEKDSAMYTQAILQMTNQGCEKGIIAFNKYLDSFENGLFKMQALNSLARCYTDEQDFDQAISTYDAIIDLRPNAQLQNALINAINLCFAQDSFARAIPYLKLQENITNEQSSLLEVYEGLAKAYLETDSCNQAQEYLGKIAMFENADSSVLQRADYTLARCLMKNKEYNKALTQFQKVANNNDGKLGAESQYLVAYLYYLKEEYDSSKTAIIKVRDNFNSYDYFVAKSFILLADNFVKLDKLSSAKSTLQNIIDYYEGEDLKKVAQEKLKAIELEEQQKAAQQKLIQDAQEENIEYQNEEDEK